ncbi:MAG: DUF4143 domain-containing protein [Candidatus Coatesbacteria bacterium]
MVRRRIWSALLEDAWLQRSVTWLSGVRRSGKTVLSRSLPRVEYFDCELPRVRNLMEDPEKFLKKLRRKRIILDEIHKLADPSELLKIAADYFPDIHVLATGSSTLGASRKFRDTLTGRKTSLWLTPMTTADAKEFRRTSLEHRMLHGGLPPFFQAAKPEDRTFLEWMDAYWARDIEELFRLQRRVSFQRFMGLLFRRSGGIFEATTYAAPCEVSRVTLGSYLNVLEETHVAHVIRPFNSRRAIEIVAAPKVYAFDTGFVCYFNGWDTISGERRGFLYEHLVLNELHAGLQTRQVSYWRDKHGNEVDFVLARRGAPPVAIECKWKAGEFNPSGLLAFARAYPGARLLLVAPDIARIESRDYGGHAIALTPLALLAGSIGHKGL